MTSHLSPDEFVDALDERLPLARATHLDGCEACHAELADLRAALTDASTVPANEPSPLFWDHFSARVAEATTVAPASPQPWWQWQSLWKPVAGTAAVAAAVVLALTLRPGADAPINPASETAVTDAGLISPIDDDGSWEFVVGLSADMAFEDVRAAVTPAAGTADEIIAALTAEQRAEFVRLLRQEMDGP